MDTIKIWAGIIGVIGLLLGFGGSQLISIDIVDNSYVCSSNDKLGIFDRLSGARGYYTNEVGEEKYNTCINGNWVTVKDYAKSKGIDPKVFIKEATVDEPVIATCEPITQFVEKVVYSTDCPIKVIAYTNTGKYYCEGIGPGQKCTSTNEILSSLG